MRYFNIKQTLKPRHACQKLLPLAKNHAMTDKDTSERHQCRECGSPLYNGRSDKQFCSVKCKTHYHNYRQASLRRKQQRTKDILERNYNILLGCLTINKKSIPFRELDAVGFDRSACTGTYMSKGYRIFRCFDIEYHMSGAKIYDLTTSYEQVQPPASQEEEW